MEQKRKIFAIIVFTALVSIILTNTVRDIMYVQNGSVNNKLSNIVNILKNYSLYDIDEEKLGDYAASGMVVAVDDPYTNYYNKDEFRAYQTNLSNSFTGIGIVLSVDNNINKLVIVSPVDGSPAARAGILAGDYIVAVDGVRYSGDDMNEVVSIIRGDKLENVKGTSVTLTVERNGVLVDYTVMREVVKTDSVSEKMLDNGIGYLRISSFNSADTGDEESTDTYDEFVESLKILNDNGMNKLIIDLRGNPGGNLNIVNKIADDLLPAGIITYTETKNGKRVDYNSYDGEIDMPMAVLVNGASASGSEVLTGALKDYKKAVVIGTKTYGKGIVQTVIPLSDGSGMSVTTSKYFSPSGVCIHGVGIEPDIVVEMDDIKQISLLDYNEDVQLQKAVEVLSNK